MAQTTYAYDSHGRVASRTDARNGATFYTYNAAVKSRAWVRTVAGAPGS